MKAKPDKVIQPPLPKEFVESLASLLKEETQDFLQSYDFPWLRGLRQSPRKVPEGGLGSWVEGLGDTIPWEKDGFYISLESAAGTHPLHEAGAYYLQEPSAMAAVAALAPKPGEWVLDLCAAPGGKSTQIAARMGGQGLLCSNEPIASRAQVLSSNVERMGVSNALVTCETPDRLSKKWPDAFDRVLVDAPCSGEGMFRRHPETRLEWTEQSPAGCARRQRDILREGAKMVKAGGILCYSTCTFNTVENEGVVESFLRETPEFSLVPFSLSPDVRTGSGMLHLFPHKVRGEGHFVALMKRQSGGEPMGTGSRSILPGPDKGTIAAYRAFCGEAGLAGPEPSGLFAGRLVSIASLPDISGLKVLRAGLHLGEMRGRHFIPDHAWAMSDQMPQSCPSLALTLPQAESYLRGEAMPAPENGRGWVLLRLAGLALGWGKIADGRVQNHYPKGLRRV